MKLSPMKCHKGDTHNLTIKGWIYEPKLDGIRALCYVNHGLQFISRAGNDLTERFPEFDFRDAIHAKSCILDGEIIAYKRGVPRFQALQEGNEATFVVFDILQLNGKSLTRKPLTERKHLLEQVVSDADALEKIAFTSDGPKLWRLMLKKRMEGVVAKDPTSFYYSGTRSSHWIKIKFRETIDVVIAGYTKKKRGISSLALALYTNTGNLQYIGKVGTGFSEDTIRTLTKKLKPLEIDKCPIDVALIKVPNGIHWVKPKLVAEVKFVEFTKDRILRTSAFIRLRDDKKAKECTFREQAPTK